MMRNALIPGHVLLICSSGHDHDMAYEQAERLHTEPCWQCGAPLVRIIYGPEVPVRICALERPLGEGILQCSKA